MIAPSISFHPCIQKIAGEHRKHSLSSCPDDMHMARLQPDSRDLMGGPADIKRVPKNLGQVREALRLGDIDHYEMQQWAC